MIQFNLETTEASAPGSALSVCVIGVGGSGTNVIDKMALEGLAGADLISLNCDARALSSSMAGTKLQLGKALTQGLGCGGDPELGEEAALASTEEIRELLTGRNMVFICAGLGGGTGSGAAPVVARMARGAGAFVVVFATLPFAFEGRRRSSQANTALEDLRKYANALVVFENDRMGELVVPKKGVQEAFELADKIIGQSVRAVTSLVTQPGLIHIGMDDLVTALRNTDSRCLFGFGQAKGENRAVEALSLALKSPLLDRGQMLSGARNVLVQICGGTGLTLFEIETLMRELGKHVHEDTQILFGAATDAKLQEHLTVTLLTSLNKPEPVAAVPVEVLPLPPAAELLATVPSPAPGEAGAAPVALAPVAAAPAAPVRAVPAIQAIVEDELFPETAPAAAPGAESSVIEIPAVLTRPSAARAGFVPPASAPKVAPPAAVGEPEPGPVKAALPMEEELLVEEEFEPVPPALVTGVEEVTNVEEPEMAEPEMAVPEFQEEIEAVQPGPEPALDPEPETAPVVPERVLRIERKTPAAATARPETAPPVKRFTLSDIIKRGTRPVEEPVKKYEAPPEPPAPVRPAAAPLLHHAPEYDRITPIRPISAGRSTVPAPAPAPAPASPLTASKPAAPVRSIPTQQQTFDERLQPATSGSRFERTSPTVEEGEDLDVPTFLRRKR